MSRINSDNRKVCYEKALPEYSFAAHAEGAAVNRTLPKKTTASHSFIAKPSQAGLIQAVGAFG